MGKSLNNPMMTWYGKVGANVFSKLFGQQIIREYAKPSNPNTEKQQLVRARFLFMTKLGLVFDQSSLLALKSKANSNGMFPNNMFFSLNYKNITGTTPDNVSIDPSKIVVADGNLPGVMFSPSIGTTTPGRLTLTVTDVLATAPRASDEDNIYVVAYCPDAEMAILSAPARRTDGATLSVAYPAAWSGLEVHCYGFVMGGLEKTTGKASRSEYIGHAELG